MKKSNKRSETPSPKFQYNPITPNHIQAMPLKAFLKTVKKSDSEEALGIYSSFEEKIFLDLLTYELGISYN